MKASIATIGLVAAALVASGCATKKYVRNTTAPIQAKVDQVGEQTTRNGQQIEETRGQLKQVDERAQSGISAAQERAATADQNAKAADQHAGDAMNKASQAGQMAEQNQRTVNALRGVVDGLDDYKLQTSVSVPFGFDKSALSESARADLDKMVGAVKSDKRYFIAVEGFTDKTGSKAYNEALSRKRADAVVRYLITEHDVPLFRIHTIGLGEDKPVDTANTRDARARNRRVEVKVFTADQPAGALNASTSGNNR